MIKICFEVSTMQQVQGKKDRKIFLQQIEFQPLNVFEQRSESLKSQLAKLFPFHGHQIDLSRTSQVRMEIGEDAWFKSHNSLCLWG
jgi:hypothetical protein